jgi:hypothetical protein
VADLLKPYFQLEIILQSGKAVYATDQRFDSELPKEPFTIKSIKTASGFGTPFDKLELPDHVRGENFLRLISKLQQCNGFEFYYSHKNGPVFTAKQALLLANTVFGKNLKDFKIHGMKLDSELVSLLTFFPKLEGIAFDFSSADDVLVAKLRELPSINDIIATNITKSALSAKGIDELTSLPLKSLTIGTDLGQWGTTLATSLSKMPQLTYLRLDGRMADDAFFQELAKAPKLEILRIQGSKLTDAGLVHLGKIATLRLIDLGKSPVTEEGLKKLREAKPQLGISHATLPVPPVVK